MGSGLRYSRQLTLDGWGAAGQARLTAARVMVIGLGGLGVPAATYLATSGTGALVLNDFDTIDETNLPRQPLYQSADVGRLKAAVAARRLGRLNPECKINTIERRLDADALAEVVATCDVVIDGSDNFTTRFAVNRASVATRTPLVSGAAIRYEAQLAVFRPDRGGPCYRCLYDEQGEDLEDCRGQGVVAPMVGLVGCAMALEAIRIVVGLDGDDRCRVQLFDARGSRWRAVELQRDPRCPVCSGATRSQAESD